MLKGSLRRMMIILSVLALLLNTSITAASAEDVITNSDNLYRSSSNCTWVRATISNPSAQVKAETTTFSTTRGYVPIFKQWLDCAKYWERPTWLIQSTMQLLAYIDGEWLYCRGLDQWYSNDKPATWIELHWDYGSLPPCGTAWYATYGGGYVRNGNWYGGWAPSGNQYLTWRPTLAGKTSAPPGPAPAPPAWFKADGSIDYSKLPARMPIGQADGTLQRTRSGAPVTVDVKKLYAPPSNPTTQQLTAPLPPGVTLSYKPDSLEGPKEWTAPPLQSDTSTAH